MAGVCRQLEPTQTPMTVDDRLTTTTAAELVTLPLLLLTRMSLFVWSLKSSVMALYHLLPTRFLLPT